MRERESEREREREIERERWNVYGCVCEREKKGLFCAYKTERRREREREIGARM